MVITQTHLVGEQGAPTWPAPDPSAAQTPRLDPRLPVELLEARGDWWHVRCANGWETWTDGRWLVQPPTVTATPDLTRTLAPLGAALAVLGAFLPWYRGTGYSLNGWDLGFWALFRDQATNAGPKAGLVMMLSAFAVLAVVTELPGWIVLACCAPAGNTAGLGLFRWLTADGARPGLGPGLVIGFAGAALIAVAAWPVVFGNVNVRS